jgi:hypothetical protein
MSNEVFKAILNKIRFKNNYLFNFNVLALTLLFSLIGNEVRLRKVIGQLSGVFC